MAKGIFNILTDKIFPSSAAGNNQIENDSSRALLFSQPISRGDSDAALDHITGRFVARQNPTGQTAAVNSDGADNQKTVADFLRQIQNSQPFDEAALSKKKEHVELKLSKPPEKLSVADYDAATWRAVFDKAGYSSLTDEEVGMAVQAMKNTGYKSTEDGFSLSNLRRFDAKPGPMFVETDGAMIEKAKQAGEAVVQFREYKTAQSDAVQERARNEVNQMFADQGRVLWNSAVNIAEGTINGAVDIALSNNGQIPAQVYNDLPEQVKPHVDFSPVKSDYRSEMMRRNIEGKLDGDGIKAGQFIETGVTIAAPLVIGAAMTPKAAPQSLSELNGLPKGSGDLQVRRWYVPKSKSLNTNVKFTEANAKALHAERNALKIKARDMMINRKMAADLKITDPIRPFEYYVDKYTKQGYTGESLWKKIIKGSAKPNAKVNKMFGIEE